jgi:hypothetical protein
MALPALEKLNHKPFKLKGFDKDGVATVTNWDDGALAALPGGCKATVSSHADPKSSKDAVNAISADNEFSSPRGGNNGAGLLDGVRRPSCSRAMRREGLR